MYFLSKLDWTNVIIYLIWPLIELILFIKYPLIMTTLLTISFIIWYLIVHQLPHDKSWGLVIAMLLLNLVD